jgi:(E)-4-hydroxy-3-methylbut-2-enyl-diphosphate synthase
MELSQRRRKTRRVSYGEVAVGGGAPISIQSMTTCPASETDRVLAEIGALSRAGCELVRVSVESDQDIASLPRVCEGSPIPVIADVHFDFELAVKAARKGVKGLRINPGNIGGVDKARKVIEAAADAGVPVRIGVNAGSIERDLRDLQEKEPARSLCESAQRCLEMIEGIGFEQAVFSLKSSVPAVTVEANMLFAAGNDYPIHIGVTEAGPPVSGTAKSSVALTLLLLEGIGDTVRVSLSGDPVREVIAAAAILSSLGLRDDFPDIVSCPTCGRCRIDVAAIAERLERELLGIGRRMRIAVMGCEVNGPGEAREADIGIAGTRRGAVLFKRGEVVRTLDDDIEKVFVEEVRRLVKGHSI